MCLVESIRFSSPPTQFNGHVIIPDIPGVWGLDCAPMNFFYFPDIYTKLQPWMWSQYEKIKCSPLTNRVASFVRSVMCLSLATHRYVPEFSPTALRMFKMDVFPDNVMLASLPSDKLSVSFSHVIEGFGLPLNSHSILTDSPSMTVLFTGSFVTWG